MTTEDYDRLHMMAPNGLLALDAARLQKFEADAIAEYVARQTGKEINRLAIRTLYDEHLFSDYCLEVAVADYFRQKDNANAHR